MQKKFFVYLLASALPLLPACVRETPEPEEESISPVTGEGSEEGLVKLEFSAGIEDESRTWLDGTAVKWRGTDKIAVIDNTSPYVHEFDNTDVDGGARCRFVGEAGDAASWTVVYPPSAFTRQGKDEFYVTFPAVQTAVTDGFANDSYITGAVATGKSFTMTPLCSMLKLHLDYENIKRIFIEANQNSTFTGTVRPLAGTFIVDVNHLVDDNHPEYSSDGSGITLNPPTGETTFPAGDYYVPIADFTARYGNVENMRLTFTRQDDQTASRSKTGANFSFERGKFTNFGPVDEGLSWHTMDFVFGDTGAEPNNITDEGLFWPFTQYSTNSGSSWNDRPASLHAAYGNNPWFKSADNGHLLKFHSEGEVVRYANYSNGIYTGSDVGNYIEIPALNNRALQTVEVWYTTDWFSSHSAAACPHIRNSSNEDVNYIFSRSEGYHKYELFDTECDTPYRYQLVVSDGVNAGPVIARLKLTYSDEVDIDHLELPSGLSSEGAFNTLRNFFITSTFTAASERMAGTSAYEYGVVVRGMRMTVDGDHSGEHERDTVFRMTDMRGTVDGTIVTWTTTPRIIADDILDRNFSYYTYVCLPGSSQDPIEMTPSSFGTDWIAGPLCTLVRPTYTWNGEQTNYLYASDTSVELAGRVTPQYSVEQAYDFGFIYRDETADGAWVFTGFDQNPNAETGTLDGYVCNGTTDYHDLSFTITGMTAGHTYAYKPIAVQHGVYNFQSGTMHRFDYLLINAPEETLTMSGPVVAWATTPAGHYTAATTGKIAAGSAAVSHVKSGSSLQTGWLYGTSAAPTTSAGAGSATTYASTMAVAATTALAGLTDADNATAYFRPYVKFASGSVNYGAATDQTFTCPAVGVSASGTGYLWQTAFKADLTATTICGDSECAVEVGYQTSNDGGETWSAWTSSQTGLAAGSHTISEATLQVEGPQSVRYGVRRSGSSDNFTQYRTIALAHPLTSAYTYGSSYYPDNETVVVAGSFEPLNVAPGTIEYGVGYRTNYYNGSAWVLGDVHHTAFTDTSSSWASWYEVTLGGTQTGVHEHQKDTILASNMRSNRLRFWFVARLKGSRSLPEYNVNGTTAGAARSGNYATTFTWSEGSTYSRRYMINWARNYNADAAVLPILPDNTSGYLKNLSISYFNGTGHTSQTGKIRLPGGYYMELSFDTKVSDHFVDADTPVSGCTKNDGTGHLRVRSNSVNDYIALPAITGYRPSRILLYHRGFRAKSYYQEAQASQVIYPFLTSDDDAGGDPSLVIPSVGGTESDGNETVLTFPFDSFKSTTAGQCLHLHFSSKPVSNFEDATKMDFSEWQSHNIWIDYTVAP